MARRQTENQQGDDLSPTASNAGAIDASAHAGDELIAAFRAGIERFGARASSPDALTATENEELDAIVALSGRLDFGFKDLGKNDAYGVPFKLADSERDARGKLATSLDSFVSMLRGTHEVRLAGGAREFLPNLESPALRGKIARQATQILILLAEIQAKRVSLEGKLDKQFETRLVTLQKYLAIPGARLLIEAYLALASDPQYSGGRGMCIHINHALRTVGSFHKFPILIGHSLIRDYQELEERGGTR
jgi:hypothetical protein